MLRSVIEARLIKGKSAWSQPSCPTRYLLNVQDPIVVGNTFGRSQRDQWSWSSRQGRRPINAGFTTGLNEAPMAGDHFCCLRRWKICASVKNVQTPSWNNAKLPTCQPWNLFDTLKAGVSLSQHRYHQGRRRLCSVEALSPSLQRSMEGVKSPLSTGSRCYQRIWCDPYGSQMPLLVSTYAPTPQASTSRSWRCWNWFTALSIRLSKRWKKLWKGCLTQNLKKSYRWSSYPWNLLRYLKSELSVDSY